MKRSDFRLESALRWRELQLRHQRETLTRLMAEEQRAQEALEQFVQERESAREDLRQSRSIDAAELRALTLDVSVKAQRAVEQRQRTIEAERRVRLIETLKQRQVADRGPNTDRNMENTVKFRSPR